MLLISTIYAFQVIPGSDESLAFERSFDACANEAERHRQELAREVPGIELAPIVLYEMQLRDLTADAALDVLNKRLSLLDAILALKRPVTTIPAEVVS